MYDANLEESRAFHSRHDDLVTFRWVRCSFVFSHANVHSITFSYTLPEAHFIAYGYTYTDDGPVWSGDYSLHNDSRACVQFDNGSSRCDYYVRNGDRIELITTDGLRFPVRNQSVAAK